MKFLHLRSRRLASDFCSARHYRPGPGGGGGGGAGHPGGGGGGPPANAGPGPLPPLPRPPGGGGGGPAMPVEPGPPLGGGGIAAIVKVCPFAAMVCASTINRLNSPGLLTPLKVIREPSL